MDGGGEAFDARAARPLAGRRVLVTRARDQGAGLVRDLESKGAEVLWIPAIETVFSPPGEMEIPHLLELERVPWIAFTSPNGVRYFRELLAGRGLRLPGTVRVAAVGSATQRALEDEGIPVSVRPKIATGLGLGRHLADSFPPSRILAPRGRKGREEMAAALEEAGWKVLPVTCYDTVPTRITDADLNALSEGVDAALFASPSQVRNLWNALDAPRRELLRRCLLIPIGTTTARAIEKLGLPHAPPPREFSAEGLVEALLAHLA